MTLPRADFVTVDPDTREIIVGYPVGLTPAQVLAIQQALKNVVGVAGGAYYRSSSLQLNNQEVVFDRVGVFPTPGYAPALVIGGIRRALDPRLPITAMDVELRVAWCACRGHNTAAVRATFLGGMLPPQGGEQFLLELSVQIERFNLGDFVDRIADLAARALQLLKQNGVFVQHLRVEVGEVSCEPPESPSLG